MSNDTEFWFESAGARLFAVERGEGRPVILFHGGLANHLAFGAGVAVRAALRHPELVEALVVLTPAFGGADLGLLPAQQAAMRAMDAAGSRAPTEGIPVLHPLFAALPASIQERARAMVDAFDPASVAASTRFMDSGAQPFATGAELAAIAAPTLLVPGTDPTHPPEVAEVYRRELRHCTVRDLVPADFTADYASAIAGFLDRELGPSSGRAGGSSR